MRRSWTQRTDYTHGLNLNHRANANGEGFWCHGSGQKRLEWEHRSLLDGEKLHGSFWKKNLSVEDVSCCNLLRTFESARFRMSLGIHAVHIATSYSTIAKRPFFLSRLHLTQWVDGWGIDLFSVRASHPARAAPRKPTRCSHPYFHTNTVIDNYRTSTFSKWVFIANCSV